MSFEQTYVVLQDLRSKIGSLSPVTRRDGGVLGQPKSLGRDPFEMGARTADSSTKDRPELSVQGGVREKEAIDSLRDERTKGIAPTMDTVLITPMDAVSSSDDGDDTTWGIVAVGANTSQLTGNQVRVAVLDTGIDATHPAFKNVAAGFEDVSIVEEDFSGDGIGDPNGHGTHCAGTIFGRPIDGVRIGIAPGVTDAFIGKVLRDDRSGNTDMLFKGLNWAMQKDVDVISMSLGFDFPGYVKRMTDNGWPADLATSNALVAYRDNLRLLDNLAAQTKALIPFNGGTVIVAASGNESQPDRRIAASLPSAADGVVSVGAVAKSNNGLTVAPFSNTKPRVSAPGVAIKSAKTGGGLVSKSGTSMACPHVAGIAALWWEALRQNHSNVTSAQVEVQLLANLVIDVFASDVDPIDIGDGLPQAPQN